MKIKIHKNITVIEVNDLVLLQEISSRTRFKSVVIKQLSPNTFVVDNQESDALIKELEDNKIGIRIIDCATA